MFTESIKIVVNDKWERRVLRLASFFIIVDKSCRPGEFRFRPFFKG